MASANGLLHDMPTIQPAAPNTASVIWCLALLIINGASLVGNLLEINIDYCA
jgi:hypothetical protein